MEIILFTITLIIIIGLWLFDYNLKKKYQLNLKNQEEIPYLTTTLNKWDSLTPYQKEAYCLNSYGHKNFNKLTDRQIINIFLKR